MDYQHTLLKNEGQVVKTVFSGGGDYWKWEEIKKE
jgi:hypothetical protein